MNKFKKLAIGLTIIAASLASAVAAPSATRHTKLLSIKQRVMINTGETKTSASLVSPTAHSGGGGLVTVTNSFAAVPLPDAEVAKFQAARVPRFDYEGFWATMDQLQACENELGDNAAAYVPPYSYGDDGGYPYYWYIYQTQPTSTKTYANQLMANYPSPAGYLPEQYQSPTGTSVACNNGGNPAAFTAAAVVREAVSNYARDSQEVLDYVTSQFWIKGSGAANPLKAAVVQYLRENEIEFAWVDVEFEYQHLTAPPANRRISMSFQISRADEPTTRGSYLGSQLVLAPEVNLAESNLSVRANHIDIKYSAYSQYPDFTINSPANSAQMQALMTDAQLNPNGVLSWKIEQRGDSTISPRICAGISNCTSTAGQFKTTSGAYDPDFARAGFGEIPNAPYTLEHPGPIEDLSGIKCLVKGSGSTRCRLDKHNVATLMQYANAIDGTLDYVGRWEVDFKGHPPTFEELGRATEFDVCYGVEFKNSIQASYWVRRPRWKLNLYWQPGGVDYQFAAEPAYQFENVGQLPDPVTYTTYPTVENNYNMLGSDVSSNVRANNMPSTPAGTSDSSPATNYAAVNIAEQDPQSLGLPNREGAIMINPFVSRVSSTGVLFNGLANNWMIYRPVGTLPAERTVAAQMRGAAPVYKAASIEVSKALPRGWLARTGGNPTVRTADFNCVDQNEPALYALQAQERGAPPATEAWDGPPPDPVVPTGQTPYVGTTSGHKNGTRANVNVPGDPGTGVTNDLCQLSFVPWSSVSYEIDRVGPLPDPRFVPPEICNTTIDVSDGVSLPYNGSECQAPVNYYKRSVRVTQANTLYFENQTQPACNETCEIGGAVKLCNRPYARR